MPARRKTHFKPGRLLKEALHQTHEPQAGGGDSAAATGAAMPQVSPPSEESNAV
ncbi:HU family DNA-binding protein [bacterium]|nr:HU family DNA-binding protein [bacterium]